jgi:hypothetical protein
MNGDGSPVDPDGGSPSGSGVVLIWTVNWCATDAFHHYIPETHPWA